MISCLSICKLLLNVLLFDCSTIKVFLSSEEKKKSMLMWLQPKLLEHWAVMPALVRGPVRVITGQLDASRFAKDFDLTKVSVKEFNELLFI